MIELAHARIERTDYGCLTTFTDGKSIASIPHWQDHHYHVVSHRLGYGDDLHSYCFEHDVAHSLVAETLFGTPSIVLWGLAHGEEVSRHTAVIEEALAQLLQRWLRANEEPIIADFDWHALKRRALGLFGTAQP